MNSFTAVSKYEISYSTSYSSRLVAEPESRDSRDLSRVTTRPISTKSFCKTLFLESNFARANKMSHFFLRNCFYLVNTTTSVESENCLQ